MEVPFEQKICPPQQLAVRLGSSARPLVFTNGVFDILHRGHVTYLAEASSLGATLLVAVNSDASARRLDKGEERPFNPLADRMAEIGRASCRERVESQGVAGSCKGIPWMRI